VSHFEPCQPFLFELSDFYPNPDPSCDKNESENGVCENNGTPFLVPGQSKSAIVDRSPFWVVDLVATSNDMPMDHLQSDQWQEHLQSTSFWLALCRIQESINRNICVYKAPGVHFTKALLASLSKFHCYQHNSMSWCFPKS